MWELYALWTWMSAFLAASSTAATGLSPEAAPGASGNDAFLAIGVSGLAGCLLSPLSFTASRPWLLAFAAVWGPPSSPTPACTPPC